MTRLERKPCWRSSKKNHGVICLLGGNRWLTSLRWASDRTHKNWILSFKSKQQVAQEWIQAPVYLIMVYQPTKQAQSGQTSSIGRSAMQSQRWTITWCAHHFTKLRQSRHSNYRNPKKDSSKDTRKVATLKQQKLWIQPCFNSRSRTNRATAKSN